MSQSTRLVSTANARQNAGGYRGTKIAEIGIIAALACAAVLELLVTWQLKHSVDVLSYHLLAFAAVLYIFDQQQPRPKFHSTPLAILCGCLLLTSAIYKARTIVSGN